MLESNRDITERERHEAALRQSEERFRSLAETAHEGIWLIDADACTLFANARMAELLGTTPALLGERRVLEFCFPDDVPLAHERIGQNLRGQAEQFDFRFRRADGTPIYVLACTSPVRDAAGEIIGALGMFSDLTERRQAEEERQRLEGDKDEFLAAVSHDLKNPLATIKATAQLLQRQAARGRTDPDRLAAGLASIDAVSSQIVAQLDTLLEVTRERLGRPMDLERQVVDLVALTRQVAAEQQVITDRHQLEVIAGETELVGHWDTSRLRRVLSNLLGNAIKFSPRGGPISVVVERDQDMAVLMVRDHGLGIPATDLPRIFEHFHRAGNVARSIPGTGIGLASVRHIVEQHGGTVDVASREGEGSTFTVRLPLQLAAHIRQTVTGGLAPPADGT